MRYKINSTGNVILAEKAFMDATYPNNYTLLSDPSPSTASLRRAEINTRLETIDTLADKPRTRRELALGVTATMTYVTTLNAEAVALRAELATLGA